MASWSDLPKELVERISKFVDNHIDILRIRAVRSSWRSAFPPNFKIPKPQFPIKLPYKLPFPHQPMFWTTDLKSHCYLIESTVYLFQLPHPPHTGWLVKILKTAYEGVKILNPLTNRVIDDLPDKKLNLLDLRVSQVCKFYHVHWVLNYHIHCLLGYDLFNKALPIWNNQTNQFSVMATSIFDHLLCFKSGDEKWTTLKDPTSKIVDISVYKENFYVVDTYGETIMYDPSSFNETNVSSNVKGLSSSIFNGWGSKKRLVESGGELFLVDMFLDTDVKTELHGSQPSWKCPKEIKVYRLDEEQHEWIAVHTLGDQIFFAGDDCCFSVSSSDFGDQCRGNCIYYVNGGITVNMRISPPKYYAYGFEDYLVCGLSKEVKLRYKGLHGHHTGIFSLQDGKLGSLLSFLEYADILWPPPSWLFTDDDQADSKKLLRSVIDDRHVRSFNDRPYMKKVWF
ncbi:F-box protein SKIP23-like [Solanum verrucosum]|uniref:F-box protein SKIP23-like n=1 Tax=Solanum verrucosum TaxID=315347 RepID=UPI0020D11594|nr:F-box protein SKIP23-like [Solanum verrucosum]